MLRSDRWLVGDDEVALEHRVALESAGVKVRPVGNEPIIGIADSTSELNPCHLPLRHLVGSVRSGIEAAGGLTVTFPMMALGEDLMKPTAMLYRNLAAMEVEETLRAYPIDGVVVLANCDKSIPAGLMGAASAGIPTLLVTGGARPACRFMGRTLGSGTDLWRLWDERRRGALDSAQWAELERCLAESTGACNTMGTTSTMAILAEVLGFVLPGASTLTAGDGGAGALAEAAGRRIVAMVRDGIDPKTHCTEASLTNALVVLNAIGGSTNALLHLAALFGRLGIPFPLDAVDRIGRNVPLLVDVQPAGSGLVPDLADAGGVPALLKVLRPFLLGDALLADGRTVDAVTVSAPAPGPFSVLRPLDRPLQEGGAFRVVRGTLAPDGAVVKRAAASPTLLSHRGRAVVFRSYEELRRRIDDPALEVDESSILVLAGCGPVGGPGMPEWGMIPIPTKLLLRGVKDMVRVTDARMSGTSYGTCFLHVAPEAAVGGPLALVRDGDWIDVDADAGRLDLLVDENELGRRRASWRPPSFPEQRGWPALYRQYVTQAPHGCDLSLLTGDAAQHRVEPVVGRS